MLDKINKELVRIRDEPPGHQAAALSRLVDFVSFLNRIGFRGREISEKFPFLQAIRDLKKGQSGHLSEHMRRRVIYKLKSYHH